MQVHIFRGPGRLFGITQDSAGANLPDEVGPWVPFKTLVMHKGEPIPGVDTDECLNDIEAHGFHVTDAHIRVTERFV
jgi:hypothetical protein